MIKDDHVAIIDVELKSRKTWKENNELLIDGGVGLNITSSKSGKKWA